MSLESQSGKKKSVSFPCTKRMNFPEHIYWLHWAALQMCRHSSHQQGIHIRNNCTPLRPRPPGARGISAPSDLCLYTLPCKRTPGVWHGTQKGWVKRHPRVFKRAHCISKQDRDSESCGWAGGCKAMALVSTHMSWRKAFGRVGSAAAKVVLKESRVSSWLISVLRFQKLRAKKGERLALGYDAEGSKTFMLHQRKSK